MSEIDFDKAIEEARRSPVALARVARDLRDEITAVGKSTGKASTKSATLARLGGYVDMVNQIRGQHTRTAKQVAALGNPSASAEAVADSFIGAKSADHRGHLLGSPADLNRDGWEALLKGATTGTGTTIDLGNEVHRKAFSRIVTKSEFDGATIGSGWSTGAMIPDVPFTPLGQALEQTRVAALFPHQVVGTSRWEYVRHATTTGGPDATAELAYFPTLSFGVDVVEGTVQKIGGQFAHSAELARDYEAWSTTIPTELSRLLLDRESRFLLSGVVEDDTVGATPTADGLLGAAALTAAVSSSDTAVGSPGLRAIQKGVTTLRSGAAFAVADTIILSPGTFGVLRGATNSLGDFILTPAAGDGEVPTLWGMRVCVTTQIADGTALICDSKQFATVMVRDGISVRSTSEGATLAGKDEVLWIVKERLGLAVPRPAAGLVLTGIVA